MALPTLNPYYISRRGQSQAERLIVKRRTHEAEVKEKWKENSRYFATSDMRASKQEAWSSSQSFLDSMAAYESQGKKEMKKKSLEERRIRLGSLLNQEMRQYEQELKDISPNRVLTMKERAERLKTERIQRDKKLAEEKLHEHWRSNCPKLREVESRQMQRAVQEEWKDQVKRREEEMESSRRERERYELAMETERLAALQLDDELKARKKRSDQDHVKSLQEQMIEMKAREEEAALLELQHGALIKEQMELERAENERKKLEQAQKQTDFRRVLLKQHKAQMRRKSRQIQEALELDLKILEEFTMKEQEDVALQTARRRKAEEDVQWMKQVVAEQIELEQRRERELESLYQEEASRMWRKREEEWEREKLARERLMAEVLAERQEQIETNMAIVKEQQAESIQKREELLRDIELTNQMTTRETYRREVEKTQRMEELNQQASEREKQALRALEMEALELEKQRQFDENYDSYLREEETKLTHRHSPKFYGRKKYAWY